MKLTDEQIIKALECCISHKGNVACKSGCPFHEQELCIEDGDALLKHSLNLINRQKAEIEKLNVELVGMRGACESYKMHYDNARAEIERLKAEIRNTDNILNSLDRPLVEVKAEVIKEFAERLKKEAYIDDYFDLSVKESSIDNLVKEMEGDADV